MIIIPTKLVFWMGLLVFWMCQLVFWYPSLVLWMCQLVFWSFCWYFDWGGKRLFFQLVFWNNSFFQLVFWNDYFFQLVFWKGIVGILISFIGILFTQWYFVHWYFNQVLSICSDPLFPTKRRTPKIPKSPPSTRRLYWSRKNTEQIFIFLAISCQDEAGLRTPRPYPLLVFAGDITLRGPLFWTKNWVKIRTLVLSHLWSWAGFDFSFFYFPSFDKIPFFFWRCPKVKKLKKIVNYVLASQDDFGMPKKTL